MDNRFWSYLLDGDLSGFAPVFRTAARNGFDRSIEDGPLRRVVKSGVGIWYLDDLSISNDCASRISRVDSAIEGLSIGSLVLSPGYVRMDGQLVEDVVYKRKS